jgi:hypothetical protein
MTACAGVTDWKALLDQAEEQGLAPLLYWHCRDLPDSVPEHSKRVMRLLFLRHQHVNRIMLKVLERVAGLFREAGIDVLALKGIALCLTAYPEAGLRPMRDMDLLVRPEQALAAQDLLVRSGFSASTAPRPDDHFHLPSLHMVVDAIPVCIELHHDFFPDCPPYYCKQDFDSLRQRAFSFPVGATQVLTLGHEDMLWHVFHHGFHAPLTYEPLKLISVADMVTMVEVRLEEIDWERMRALHPEILAALPYFHYLTPWSEKVRSKFLWKTGAKPEGVGESFQGWPRLHLKEQAGRSFTAIIKATFLPSEWWCRVYYGVDSQWKYFKIRWFTHPRHVFWWIRLYASFLQTAQTDDSAPALGGKIRQTWRKVVAMAHKFLAMFKK